MTNTSDQTSAPRTRRSIPGTVRAQMFGPSRSIMAFPVHETSVVPEWKAPHIILTHTEVKPHLVRPETKLPAKKHVVARSFDDLVSFRVGIWAGLIASAVLWLPWAPGCIMRPIVTQGTNIPADSTDPICWCLWAGGVEDCPLRRYAWRKGRRRGLFGRIGIVIARGKKGSVRVRWVDQRVAWETDSDIVSARSLRRVVTKEAAA